LVVIEDSDQVEIGGWLIRSVSGRAIVNSIRATVSLSCVCDRVACSRRGGRKGSVVMLECCISTWAGLCQFWNIEATNSK
jgi:hypothetical protein